MPGVAVAQISLAETTGTMAAGEEMQGGRPKPPPAAQGGQLGALGQANAERNAAIENAAGAQPPPGEPNQPTPSPVYVGNSAFSRSCF